MTYDVKTRAYSLQQIAGVASECTGYDENGKCNNYYKRTSLGYALGTRDNPDTPTQHEDFADMFSNWAYNSFDYSPSGIAYGAARYNWMNYKMREWIAVKLNLPAPPAMPLDYDC